MARAVFVLVVAGEFGLFVRRAFEWASMLGESARPMAPVFVLMALAALSYATRLARRWRFPVLLASGLVLGGWVILRWPAPSIDMLPIQGDACRDFLRGRNPYTSEHPTVPWKPGFDADVSRAGDHMRSFSYPPLSLIATIPGYLAGDLRWSLLVASLASSAILVALGRRSGLPPGHVSELAALAVTCHPMGLPILQASFTEPLVFTAVCGFAYARALGSPRAEGLTLGASLCMKQFGFLAVIPLAACRRLGLRSTALAALVTAAINVPFFLWDPPGFKLGLVDALARAPVRTDSVALSPMLSSIYQIRLPPAFGFFAAIVTLALVQWRADGSLSRASAGGAATCLAFFFFGRAGHLNYYWFCGAMLWLSVALSFAEASVADAGPSRTG